MAGFELTHHVHVNWSEVNAHLSKNENGVKSKNIYRVTAKPIIEKPIHNTIKTLFGGKVLW